MNPPGRLWYSILLGAGASVDAGLPTSPQLLEGFLAQADATSQSLVEAAVRELTEAGTPSNVETVAMQLSGRGKDVEADLRAYVCKRLAQAGDSTYLANLFRPELCAIHGILIDGERPLARRLGEPSPSSTRVFSLNYDLCVERALGRSTPYLGLFQGDPYPRMVYRPGVNSDNAVGPHGSSLFLDGDGPSFPEFAHKGLVKLHGSLNWFYDPEAPGTLLCIDPDDPAVRGVAPELVFADPYKVKIRPPYMDLFQVFSISLSYSYALITLGYSWSDPHINDAVAYATTSGGMDLVCVDPFPGDRTSGPNPRQTIWVKATCASALRNEDVECAVGQGEWRTISGGLPAVVGEVLQPRIWSSDRAGDRHQ